MPNTILSIIRNIRKQKNMSIHSLAKAVGISPSMVSQIENGKTVPSVSTLFSILEALNINAGKLLSDNTPSPVKQFIKRNISECACIKNHNGKLWSDDTILVVDNEFAPSEIIPTIIRLYKNHFKAETNSLRGDQLIFLLSGSISYLVNEEIFCLNKGDSLFIHSFLPHGPCKIHTSSAQYLLCHVNEFYGWLDKELDLCNLLTKPPQSSTIQTPMMKIAKRLQYARYRRGWSQEAVRSLAGLSSGMISHIEAGRKMPSLTVLSKIAFALRIPLYYFFNDSACETPFVNIKLADRAKSKCFPLVTKEFGTPLFHSEIYRLSKANHEFKKQKSPGQFFLFILNGSIQFRFGNKLHNLYSGDFFYGLSMVEHGIKAILSKEAEILICRSDLSRFLPQTVNI